MTNTRQAPQQTASATASEHTEGRVAKTIEKQTAKLPSDLFLWAAGGCMATSLALHCYGRRHDGLFVGQWAAPLLVMGLYNKVVKLMGSDQTDAQHRECHS